MKKMEIVGAKRRKLGDGKCTPTLDLFRLLGIESIRSILMQCFTTEDILLLCQSVPGFRAFLGQNEWNINQRLKRFFDNPVAFRNLLAKQDALISGSFALQFFERVIWPTSTITICVEEGAKAAAVREYIVKKEIFIDTTPLYTEVFPNSIHDTTHFSRVGRNRSEINISGHLLT
jgi:hypothetical protein